MSSTSLFVFCAHAHGITTVTYGKAPARADKKMLA